MSLLVVNCLNWVGFHIVNFLLENSYQVDGLNEDPLSKQDHFQLFFGRNSSFTLVTKQQLSEYDVCIIIGTCSFTQEINSRYILEINDHTDFSNLHNKHISIAMPLLFGKWMPMNADGMYHQNKYISFKSELFLTKSVYIDDFINDLLHWIQDITSTDKILTKDDLKATKFMNEMELFDNRTVQTKLEIVLSHYERFKAFYSR